MDISKQQISAAIAMLEKTQAELATETGLSRPTVSNFLKSSAGWETKESTKKKMVDYLRMRGVEFIDGGVRIRDDKIVTLRGVAGFRSLMDDVYEVARTVGGDFSIINGSPVLWLKFLGEDWYKQHAARMYQVKRNINFRITAEKRGGEIAKSFAEYRWIDHSKFYFTSLYLYGSKVAFITFEDHDVVIEIMNRDNMTNTMRALFEVLWQSSAKH